MALGFKISMMTLNLRVSGKIINKVLELIFGRMVQNMSGNLMDALYKDWEQ